tara:strand:+ start:57 stop:758 length:702 start_codon:yes stop_codon:yes gene_type:complete
MSGTIVVTLYQKKVQIDEKFRIDVSQSFLHSSSDTISSISVQAEAAGTNYDVTSDKFLDIAYSSAGTKTITVTLSHSGSGSPITKTETIEVVTEAADNLFSVDSDLLSHEPDLMKYLPEHSSDFKFIHRLSQERILGQLDERGITDTSGNRISASAVKDIEECRAWSKFLALQYIMESMSNSVDDVFSDKADKYKVMADRSSNRAFLRLDYDGDGEIKSSEIGKVSIGRIIRR